MSIEEKRDEIIAEYHCQDVHGELCVDCAQCRECLKGDLLELETLVRADERAKVLDEVWRVFCKYKKDINDANYGFNFVEIAFNEVKNKYKATNTCEWIKYDYRTMCPKNHNDVDNPYWRIPVDMKHLRYCPYCGRKIVIR